MDKANTNLTHKKECISTRRVFLFLDRMDAVLSSFVAHSQFDESLAQSHQLHARSILQDQQLHQESIAFDIGTFARHQEIRLQQHQKEMELAVDIARRDSIRDAVRHTSQTAYSIIVVDALMLNGLFQLVSQFNLDSASTAPELTTIALTIALAFLFIVLSIFHGLRLQQTAAQYNISNPIHRYKTCGLLHESFPSYYHCHCVWLEYWAVKFFLLGSALTAVSLAVFGHSTYYESQLGQLGAAVMFSTLCCLTALVLLVGERFVTTNVRSVKQ